MNSIVWDGASLKLGISKGTFFAEEFIQILSDVKYWKQINESTDLEKTLRSTTEEMIFYPRGSNCFIFEKERIQQFDSFSDFNLHYSSIHVNNETKTIYSCNNGILVDNYMFNTDDSTCFKKLMSIPRFRGINNDLQSEISPRIIAQISEQIYANDTDSPLNYITEMLSLFTLSDFVSITNNSIECTISDYGSGSDKKIKFEWGDWTYFDNYSFYSMYNWMTSKDNISIDVVAKRNVVIGVILDKDISRINSKDLIKQLDLVMQFVINEKIDHYFERKELIKNQIIDFVKMVNDIRETILKLIGGFCIAFVVGLYGLIYDKFSLDSYDALVKQILQSLPLFLIILILFTLFIVSITIYQNRKYLKFKKIIITHYEENFLTNKEEWNVLSEVDSFAGFYIFCGITFFILFIITYMCFF